MKENLLKQQGPDLTDIYNSSPLHYFDGRFNHRMCHARFETHCSGISYRMNFVKLYLLALLVFNLTACSTMQAVSVESAMKRSPPRGVDYGSLVEVKTLDKQTAKFRVTVINADGLGGNQKFFRYEDMASLRVEAPKSDNSDVWLILGGILGTAALIFLVANADSVSVCSPSPCDRP